MMIIRLGSVGLDLSAKIGVHCCGSLLVVSYVLLHFHDQTPEFGSQAFLSLPEWLSLAALRTDILGHRSDFLNLPNCWMPSFRHIPQMSHVPKYKISLLVDNSIGILSEY